MISSWPALTGDAEMVVAFDQRRKHRLLVLPALFDEANKLRHQTIAVMRHLDAHHVDSFLPDLPGCNESFAPLQEQSLSSWRKAAQEAAAYACATHILTIRGGALLAPDAYPGWRYAPVSGKIILRQLMRSRIIASTEAGIQEKSATILAQGQQEGIELAGYYFGPQMMGELAESELPPSCTLADIDQASLEGPALWLRAEPDFEANQAEIMAKIIVQGLES